MASTTTIGNQIIETVDIQTIFYNRGSTLVNPPGGGIGIAAASSRYLPGNQQDSGRQSGAIRLGNTINAIHDNQAFVSVSGWKWRQYRTLAASGNYAIVPRSDCESVFIINQAGATNVTLDLSDTTLLPGMKFKFDRPTSVGNLVITLSNGTVMDTSGATGTILTITQYGFATIRILAGAVPSGPGVFVEEAANLTIS